MKTLETAEQLVEQTSSAELSRFRRWFAEFDSDVWDAQIEAYAQAGKLDAVAQETLAEYHAGKATDLASIHFSADLP